MKSKNKMKIIIIIFGIIYASLIIINLNLGDYSLNNDGTVENQDDSYSKNPKISGYWTTNFIHVDGNWSNTALTYDWCSGDGSWGNPYTIENVIIDASSSPTGSGILINNSQTEYFIIRNCTIYLSAGSSYNAGIKLVNTSNGILTNNDCSNNYGNGISLYYSCLSNTISENNANDNMGIGILLTLACNGNTITGNTASNVITDNNPTPNQDSGIIIGSSDENIISGNIVNDNTMYGIALSSDCIDNTISGNIAKNNDINGIDLSDGCDRNTISGNYIYGNNRGINIMDDSDYNLIYYNSISDNLQYNAIAFNNLGPNYFTSIGLGNYWGDYAGNDTNNDGIGDTPYNVVGGDVDYKPIMNINPYFIRRPNDVNYEAGTNNNNLKWKVIDLSQLVLTYQISMDGLLIENGLLFSDMSNIEISVDGLTIGTYLFTAEVTDQGGANSLDVVRVTVTNTAPVFIATPNDLSYETGESGNKLSWTFSDVSVNSPTYTITRNSVPIIIDNPCVSGIPIEASIDGLDEGSYLFTIEIDDGYGGIIIDSVWVTVIPIPDLNITNSLNVAIIGQSFSIEEFNITLSVCNESGHGIDTAMIILWWNDTDTFDKVINLGNGLYFVSLEPITVPPGEDPILLSMNITADGYEDKHFETYLAVDPDTLEKEVEKDGEGFPLTILIIAIASAAGGIGIAIVTIGILRKRKLTKEVI